LIKNADGEALAQGTGNAVAAYNVADSQFSTLISQRDAQERALREAAESIRAQLARVELE
jgi:hypothetical protein